MHSYLKSCAVLVFKACVYIQWNPSNPDTIGPEESVLIREVSLFQGLNKHGTWGGRKCPD